MSIPQPSSQHCFVCGVSNPVGLHLRFVETTPGEVSAEITLPDHYQGYPGITHGGVIAAMLDEVGGRSQMGNAENPRFMFTAALKIRYRRNVPTGELLRLVGKAGPSKGRYAEATSAIYDSAGVLLAEAEVQLVDLPSGLVDNVDLAALGWRVYPE